MARNFGLKRVSKLTGVEDSAVAAWSLIGALGLTMGLLAAVAVLS